MELTSLILFTADVYLDASSGKHGWLPEHISCNILKFDDALVSHEQQQDEESNQALGSKPFLCPSVSL